MAKNLLTIVFLLIVARTLVFSSQRADQVPVVSIDGIQIGMSRSSVEGVLPGPCRFDSSTRTLYHRPRNLSGRRENWEGSPVVEFDSHQEVRSVFQGKTLKVGERVFAPGSSYREVCRLLGPPDEEVGAVIRKPWETEPQTYVFHSTGLYLGVKEGKVTHFRFYRELLLHRSQGTR